MAVCTKIPYPNIHRARCALCQIARRAKAGERVPRCVHWCKECAAWHLSSRQPAGRLSRWATGGD